MFRVCHVTQVLKVLMETFIYKHEMFDLQPLSNLGVNLFSCTNLSVKRYQTAVMTRLTQWTDNHWYQYQMI